MTKEVTIEEILNSGKRLIVIIGKDETLKTEIAKRFVEANKGYGISVNPENNLHPYKQCEMIEYITSATLHDPYLVVTNSTFIVDHLVNLMKAAKSKNPDELKEKFINKRKSAFIKASKVAAYDCEDGKTKCILNNKGMIDWDTFSSVSEWLSTLYFEL
jgi:hypothetical protein